MGKKKIKKINKYKVIYADGARVSVVVAGGEEEG